MTIADWLCHLGLRGCELHKRSGFYVPMWAMPLFRLGLLVENLD